MLTSAAQLECSVYEFEFKIWTPRWTAIRQTRVGYGGVLASYFGFIPPPADTALYNE